MHARFLREPEAGPRNLGPASWYVPAASVATEILTEMAFAPPEAPLQKAILENYWPPLAFTAASSNSPGTYARCSDALEPLVKALSLPSRLGSSDASLSTSGLTSQLPDAAHAVRASHLNIRPRPCRATPLTCRNDERPHAGAVRLDSLDDRPHSAVSPERARPTSTRRARP